MKILIVEDSLTQAVALKQRLVPLGHEVAMVHDGGSALRTLLHDRHDLLISDWMMPGMDGPTLCRRVREDLSDVPYLFLMLLTSKDLRHERLEGLEAGADLFLSKPLDSVELSVALKTIGRLVDAQKTLLARIAALETAVSNSSGPPADLAIRLALETALRYALVHAQPLSLVLFGFDPSTPTPRHSLQNLVELISLWRRTGDSVESLHHHELAWLVPGLADFETLELAEQIVAASSSPTRAGIATWSPGEPPTHPPTLLHSARKALAYSLSANGPTVSHHSLLTASGAS